MDSFIRKALPALTLVFAFFVVFAAATPEDSGCCHMEIKTDSAGVWTRCAGDCSINPGPCEKAESTPGSGVWHCRCDGKDDNCDCLGYVYTAGGVFLTACPNGKCNGDSHGSCWKWQESGIDAGKWQDLCFCILSGA